MVTVAGPGTPYVVPSILTSAPIGVSWATIPGRNATPAAQQAELLNLCNRATAIIDGFCNQILRATIDTEINRGPGYRVTIHSATRIILSRWPLLSINSVKFAANAVFPRQWAQVPAGMFEPEIPPIDIYGSTAPSSAGDGGQAYLLAPGYVTWAYGRGGYVIQTNYTNGWPHAGIAADAEAGATTLEVDDCTGWGPPAGFQTGAAGVVYDGASQETVTCTAASAASGPGTLVLARPLAYDHQASVLCSTLPLQVQWAAVLMAGSQALTRGATSTTVQQTPGVASSARSPEGLAAEAELLLHPFRRTI